MDNSFSFRLPRGALEESLVSFLRKVDGSSLSTWRDILGKGYVKVNGRVERFASRKVREGDFVEIIFSWKKDLGKTCKSLEILYEDDFLLVISKESGVVCHKEETLFKNFHLVHRLDKDTSGALLLAKNSDVKKKLELLFFKRKVKKSYLALVDGCVEKKTMKIGNFLIKKRQFNGGAIWGSASCGLYAETVFRGLYCDRGHSLLLCQMITGRTHQIRVHCAEMGHPILGDYLYSQSFKYPNHVSRVMLHSFEVEFVHPVSNEIIRVKAPLKDDFKKLCPLKF